MGIGSDKTGAALITIISLGLLMTPAGFSEEEKNGVVTQKELIDTYADKMDLALYYKPLASKGQEVNDTQLLKARGVEPSGGWELQKPVTWNDVRDTLLQAGRLQAEAVNRSPAEVLKDRGVIVPGGDKEVKPKELEKFFNDPSVNKVLQTPALSLDNVLPMPLKFSTYGMLGGSKGVEITGTESQGQNIPGIADTPDVHETSPNVLPVVVPQPPNTPQPHTQPPIDVIKNPGVIEILKPEITLPPTTQPPVGPTTPPPQPPPTTQPTEPLPTTQPPEPEPPPTESTTKPPSQR